MKHERAKPPTSSSSRGDEALNSNGWKRVKLRYVCELYPRPPQIARAEDALTTFVPMPAVAESGRGITNPQLRPLKQVGPPSELLRKTKETLFAA